MEIGALLADVDARFGRMDVAGWDDPHPPPDRIVADEEYSRVTNTARWRIAGARADAWVDSLEAAGLATVERSASPVWSEPPGPVITSSDVVTPAVPGGLPVIVCRSRIEDVVDAGLTLGVGTPAVGIAVIPDCGCDACDSGSADAIEEVDSYMLPVVTGEFRRLTPARARRADVWIMVLADGRRSARNVGSRHEMAAVLADPRGWVELTGPSWLSGLAGPRQQ